MTDKKKRAAFEPRKKPTQVRARSTVEYIIEAAKRVIISEGYEAASTNRIAEIAGVSVGSLYQYFPNKEAILLALVEDTVSMAANRVRTELRGLMDIPLSESMETVIRMVLSTYQENEFVLLRLFNKIPQLQEHSGELAVELFTHSTNLTYLRQHEHEIVATDLETALLFIENAVISNIDVYVGSNPRGLSEDEFVNEMVKLVLNYLTK